MGVIVEKMDGWHFCLLNFMINLNVVLILASPVDKCGSVTEYERRQTWVRSAVGWLLLEAVLESELKEFLVNLILSDLIWNLIRWH